jgi:exodeoxyribonuclease III
VKIATWNVNSLKVRLPHVLQWMEADQPDIVGLQETKLIDENFPVAQIEAAGYHVVFSGQKTYNGVAVLSREPATDVITDLPGLKDPQRRVLGATIGPIRFLDIYVPNGQSVGSEKYAYKLDWLAACQDYIADQLAHHEHFAVVGDFNIAPEERDVHDAVAWAGEVLFSDVERQAFAGLIGLGLTDTYRLFDQEEQTFSWWDYRMGAFRRNRGLRIDHVLTSGALTSACTGCVINREPRAWEKPSDHTPVVAEFDL